jgi:hypothetical protein
MTKEEFIEKYGDVLVTFSSYYKYSFSFTGTFGDQRIEVSIGGLEVGTESRSIRELDPTSGSVYENGKEVESFYDGW